MSLPHLLLVDDSDAVLAFERAALSGHFTLSTASNGVEAVEKIRRLMPDLVLLDLSLPEMDGGEVLARVKAEPATRAIPVIVLSSEKARAAVCLEAGAALFLEKPVKPAELLAAVSRTLDASRLERRRGSLPVLYAGIGNVDFALPLEGVRGVFPQLPARPLPSAPAFLQDLVEVYGEPVCVLDLGARLGLSRSASLLDRSLILLAHDWLSLALSVDRVLDPEDVAPEDVLPRERIGGTAHAPLRETLVALVRARGTHLPVIEPRALLTPELLDLIPEALRALPGLSPGGSA